MNSLEQECKELVKENQKLVEQYNALVDKSNQLSEDANAVVAYVEDIARGLALFGTDFQINTPPAIGELKPISLFIIDDNKAFAIDMYNEIVKFVSEIKAGQRPTKAYEEWREDCRQTAQGGGIII